MKYAHPNKTSPLKRAFFKNISIFILIGIICLVAYSELKEEKYQVVTAYGPSMYPTIKNNEDLKVYPITEELNVGDIIVFNNGINKLPIVHRIILIFENNNEKFFVTRGDNLQYPDKTIISSYDIIGVVKIG